MKLEKGTRLSGGTYIGGLVGMKPRRRNLIRASLGRSQWNAGDSPRTLFRVGNESVIMICWVGVCHVDHPAAVIALGRRNEAV